MKKIVLSIAFFGSIFSMNAQALNEVKLNIFNTIVNQSVEVGYEHFIDRDQSVGVDLMINDRFSYWSESGKSGKLKKFNTNSIAVNYNFHFGGRSGEHASGMYVSPFLKYRFGDYEKDINGGANRLEVDMNSFIIGVGMGYKIVKNDAFVIAPFVNIGRNFSQEVTDEFSGIEFNAGINLGFRF
ncbi:DUF3575 domain-containing protein [Myroides ceti]|uniref:DUF3575 domain-containing protein n=1 Tax=Paenimyroides ceti TaxID=395087 RepID=A0ABT8CVR3_9FLAO|nr:DUF3575 domain-containing protein [Paenimyroides ceti]MDN3708530.1 DUF3575 domain-containing protein [Paenimyroides ceti]